MLGALRCSSFDWGVGVLTPVDVRQAGFPDRRKYVLVYHLFLSDARCGGASAQWRARLAVARCYYQRAPQS